MRSRPTPETRGIFGVTCFGAMVFWACIATILGSLDEPNLTHPVEHDSDSEAYHAQDHRAPPTVLDERPEPARDRQDDGRDQVDVELGEAAGRLVAERGSDE